MAGVMFHSCNSSSVESEVQKLNDQCPLKIDMMGIIEITSLKYENDEVTMYASVDETSIDRDFLQTCGDMVTSNIESSLNLGYNASGFLKALVDEDVNLILEYPGAQAGERCRLAFDKQEMAEYVAAINGH